MNHSGLESHLHRFYRDFGIANESLAATLPRSFLNGEKNTMNAELQKKALEQVGNPHTLINIVSRRVRQLNMGSGGISRPFVLDAQNLGAGDIALRELLEEKIAWEPPQDLTPEPPRRRRKQH